MGEPPNRIECFDISTRNCQRGQYGSFEQGVANKKLYRRFNIRTVAGPDDFASMKKS